MTLRLAIQTFDSYAVDGNLRPSTYAQRWRQCRVVVGNNQVLHVNLGNYRRVVMDNPKTPADEGQADNAAADALIRSIARFIGHQPDQDKRDLRERLGGQYLPVVRTVSYGKGLPHEVSLVASALVFAGAIANGDVASIQAYSSQQVGHGPRIGVDCSGFVNGYFVCKGTYTDRRHLIRDYVRPMATKCCDTLPDPILDHVLVWSDYSHIALIEDYRSRPAPLLLDPAPPRLRPIGFGVELPDVALSTPPPETLATPTTLRVTESCGSGRGVNDWDYEVSRRPDLSKRATDAARWTWTMLRTGQRNSRQSVFLATHL